MPMMGGQRDGGVAARPPIPGIEVLFVSGYTDDALARHGVLDPVVHFLAKPYTPASLADRVRELLDR